MSLVVNGMRLEEKMTSFESEAESKAILVARSFTCL